MSGLISMVLSKVMGKTRKINADKREVDLSFVKYLPILYNK